jgi:cell wall-associated NlpC family hydrolase
MIRVLIICLCLLQLGCFQTVDDNESPTDSTTSIDNTRNEYVDTLLDSIPVDSMAVTDSLEKSLPPASSKTINTGKVTPDQLLNFAQTLVGTPYVYGSANPKVGFDCSGFITYVFNHFNISVVRSSIDFTDVGKPVPVLNAKRGDLILFTGTNPTERHVGHMGLVVANKDSTLQFIHSTSGKQKSVTITELNDYYKGRFVSVRRIFPQNDL